MKALLSIVTCVACIGCAVTHEQAVTIASREVSRRKLPLPQGYTLQVVEGVSTPAGDSRHKIWVAVFGTPKFQDRLYTVYIDQRTARVEDIWGYHAGVPHQL